MRGSTAGAGRVAGANRPAEISETPGSRCPRFLSNQCAAPVPPGHHGGEKKNDSSIVRPAMCSRSDCMTAFVPGNAMFATEAGLKSAYLVRVRLSGSSNPVPSK